MNKKYLYLISGLLLCICVLIAYQVTQAAISNPGHGTSALEGNASLNMNSNKIINLTTPTAGTDAATMAYVDAAGSKTAFRHVAHNSYCPAITGVEKRAISGNYSAGVGNWRSGTTICNDAYTNYGCLCLYSSL